MLLDNKKQGFIIYKLWFVYFNVKDISIKRGSFIGVSSAKFTNVSLKMEGSGKQEVCYLYNVQWKYNYGTRKFVICFYNI